MAYSLNDLYGGLRFVMRVNGAVLGLGLGPVLLIWPGRVAATAEPGSDVVLWPLRLAGGLLLTYGVMLLLAAQERVIGSAGKVGMMVGNAVVALVLLVGYLQGEFGGLRLLGQIGLGAALCLLSGLCADVAALSAHRLRGVIDRFFPKISQRNTLDECSRQMF